MGCKKLVDNPYVSVCKNHICRCSIGCCEIHDKTGNLVEDKKN